MIAVTGAAGFIGSNLALTLQEYGAELLLVDHPLVAAKTANFVGLNRFQFSDHLAFVKDLCEGRLTPIAIYHLGACSATTELNWEYLTANNIDYTRRLWQYCTQKQIPYVYASSAATYGDGSQGFDDATPPETLTPLNLYGKSKNDFDIWALQQSQSPPRWAGVKFFNVYGPREAHKGRMASVALQTWKQIQATGGMKLFRSTDAVYADGGQLRDFVFVQDCVNHLIWLATHDHANGLYNSGTAAARSFLDLATAVFTALGKTPNISFMDMPADLAKQYQNYTQAVMTKLRSVSCDVPVTSLESGVKAYVEWLAQVGL
ncbi:ADP-glyceromanno-heptose 6-epimerase [soil metagenome]